MYLISVMQLSIIILIIIGSFKIIYTIPIWDQSLDSVINTELCAIVNPACFRNFTYNVPL